MPCLGGANLMPVESLANQILALLAHTATAAQTKNELARALSVAVDDPSTVVNVLVPSDKASNLAELAATGRVALVLDSAAR